MNDLLSVENELQYDASSIEVLEGVEPVRKRPGMYIGGTDERALHHLVSEILDIQLDKSEQSSDWSKKKLTKKQ